jgi:predicted RNA-binding Zn-ribbon protein involved in translation (DUF1610 family)
MDEIQFYCISCGASLSARAKSAGLSCECPQCLNVTPIPARFARAGLGYSPEILAIEVKFQCGNCRKKLRVDVRDQGQSFDCPVCHTRTKVPEWGGSPVPGGERSALQVRISREECAFLTAPIVENENVLRSA